MQLKCVDLAIFTENLPPAELKKLRNKQRKAAKKKAEQENAQAAQANQKKENKQRNANQDGDPEAPQLDELIPDKLARPEDPLEKAIEFLRPLQLLGKDRIETHLMAFEIYSRRGKLLLMLQSLKRARSIDANNPTLHNCIIRFYKALEARIASKEIDESVKLVIDRERPKLFRGANSAAELNESFLANRASNDALYEVAKIMYQLDEKRRDEAVKLLTSVELKNATLEVRRLNTCLINQSITLNSPPDHDQNVPVAQVWLLRRLPSRAAGQVQSGLPEAVPAGGRFRRCCPNRCHHPHHRPVCDVRRPRDDQRHRYDHEPGGAATDDKDDDDGTETKERKRN